MSKILSAVGVLGLCWLIAAPLELGPGGLLFLGLVAFAAVSELFGR